MNKKLQKRFSDLETQLNEIEKTKRYVNGTYGPTEAIDDDLFTGWKVKVKKLLATACGENSQHFIAFEKGESKRSFYSVLPPLSITRKHSLSFID